MSAISRVADTAYALRFLRLLTMPWEKTGAYKQGIIDADGNIIKIASTPEEKSVYTILHKLVFNIRRLLGKIPLGKTSIAKYATALWLVKEYAQLGSSEFASALNEATGFNALNQINESTTTLYEGDYTLGVNIIHPMAMDILETKGQTITVLKQVDEFYGIPIYKARHHKSKSTIYVSSEDIYYGDND